MKYAIFAAALVFPLTAAAAPVDDYVSAQMAQLRIPGLSLAVVKDGRVVKSQGYGIANLETGSLATGDTVYKTASLSKSVIAAAILLLVQDGAVSLDDKISRFLPEAPPAWRDITLRHLLGHTAGLVRDPPDYAPYREQPPMAVIEAMFAAPLGSKPGEKWLYSNAGYYVLAEVITRASGQSWDRFIAARLFAPAGMTATRLTTRAVVPGRAGGYVRAGADFANAEDWIAVRPSAAFLAPVTDVAKWDMFLTATELLTPASKALLWTPATLSDGAKTTYGFGWYVEPYLGRTRVHHDGQFPGFRADHERFPEENLSVIVLANADAARVEPLAVRVAGFYADALAPPAFAISTRTRGAMAGKPVEIAVTAKPDKAAPGSVLEVEIWDAGDKSAFRQSRSREDFKAGESRTFTFSWTPQAPGVYQVNAGLFGPRFTPAYTIAPKTAVVKVK